MNPILILFSIFFIYNVSAHPVSELAGMHQLDEAMDNNSAEDSVNKVNLTICKGKPDGTIIGDEQDNTIFYECSNGRGFLFHCPNGLIFNPTKCTCDFDPNGPTKRPPYNGTSKFDCNNKKDGFYPDEKDLHKFHECVNGYPYDFECPPLTIFDTSKNACTYENRNNQENESEESVDDADDGQPEQKSEQKSKRSPIKQLEELAEVKHVDLHKIETTTPEKFDVWID